MLNENAKKWVAALRSGEYKQGTGRLHDAADNAYCCLGVACEVYNKENPNSPLNKELIGGTVRYDNTTIALPAKVKEWLGLANISGAYNGGNYLADDNDCHGMTFDDIAALIESEPQGLFWVDAK